MLYIYTVCLDIFISLSNKMRGKRMIYLFVAVSLCVVDVQGGAGWPEYCKDASECPAGETEVMNSLDCPSFLLHCQAVDDGANTENGGGGGNSSPGSSANAGNGGNSGDSASEDAPSNQVVERGDLPICGANHGGCAAKMMADGEACVIANCDLPSGAQADTCQSINCVSLPTAPAVTADENAQSSFDQSEISDTIQKSNEADQIAVSAARSFGLTGGLPMMDAYGRPLPALCKLPKPFPMNCKPTRGEPYGEEPPTNIPYCQRIPCNAQNNGPYDQSKRLCHSQPGCYFDYELYKYREWIPTIYPGVPVCHLAIRNKVFLEKTKLAPRWSSYFTNCLINNFREEINKKTLGCAMLPMLRAFGVHPKMAGWRDIQPNECNDIGACWDDGCYHEVNINVFMVRSSQYSFNDRRSIDVTIPYGRAKCQNFDTTNPSTILKSMHICLASGCTVDPRAWIQYHDLFWLLGKQSPPHVHVALQKGLSKGEVGIDNVQEAMSAYMNTPPPRQTIEDNLSSFPFATVPEGDDICMLGQRPCPPKNFLKYGQPGRYMFPRNCPYKRPPYPLPGVGPLKGSLTGCCDSPHLCYFPKKELAFVYSGQSVYYGEWSAFSTCTKSCNGGTQMRRRKCIATDAGKCDKGLSETRSCNMEPCPSWGPWGAYGSCSRECGTGQQTRYRQCLPSLDPVNCFGSSSENRQCNKHPCVNRFGNWGGWEGSCEPCGTTMVRRRSCALFQTCLDSELIETRVCQTSCGTCRYSKSPLSPCTYVNGKGCKKIRRGRCMGGKICQSECIKYINCSDCNMA